MTVIWGGPLLRVLRHFRIGKLIRVEGPKSHYTKMGTPTMGGVMIILPVALITILLNAASLIGLNVLGRSVIVPLGVMASYALLGAVDDWEGIRGPRRGLGMRARTKFIFQVIFAIGVAWALKYLLRRPRAVLVCLPGASSRLGPLVYPHRRVPHRGHVQCGQLHRWAGWAGRADFRHRLCRLRRHRADARPDSFWPASASPSSARCSASYGSTSTPPP